MTTLISGGSLPKPLNKALPGPGAAPPPFYTKNLSTAYTSMDYEYDCYEYETLQDEIALEMMGEALLEQRQMDDSQYDDCEDEEEGFWDDPYDEWAELENREMVGIKAYSHWNEEAAYMWWMEEGRHQ